MLSDLLSPPLHPLYPHTHPPASTQCLQISSHFFVQSNLVSFSSPRSKGLVTHSCQTLFNPIDCSPRGSSVQEILQARILEWVAILFSRESSRPRDQSLVSCIAGGFFTSWPYPLLHQVGDGMEGIPFLPPQQTVQRKPVNLPGGPVAKTLCFHCKGHGSDSWSEKFYIARHWGQKRKISQRKLSEVMTDFYTDKNYTVALED